MKFTKQKNIFLVILAIVLALCMTSVSVFAATPADPTTDVAKIGDVGYTTVKAAVETATDGQTVVILQDTVVEQFRLDGKNITIDLNGHQLSGTSVANQFTDVVPASQEYNLIAIAAGAGLTVKDSVGTGCLTINPTEGNDNAHIGVKGTFTLESGTVMANGGGYYGNLIYADGGKVYIKGGELTVVDNGDRRSDYALRAENQSTVTITGGKISNSDRGYSLDIESGSTLNISGGTVEQTGTGSYMIEVYESSATITGGTFNQKGTGNLARFAKAVKAEISGGTFIHASKDEQMLIGYRGTYTITGGTFTDNGTKGIVDEYAVVSGGKFNKQLPVDACAPGLMPDATPDGEGKYTVREITPDDVLVELSYTENGVPKTQGFISITAAIDAADALMGKNINATVTIIKDYNDPAAYLRVYDAYQVIVNENVTLTCGSITTSSSGVADFRFTLINKGTIVCENITGSIGKGAMDNQGTVNCDYMEAETGGWKNSGTINLGYKVAEESIFCSFENAKTGVITGKPDAKMTVNDAVLTIGETSYIGSYVWNTDKWESFGAVSVLKAGNVLTRYDSLSDAYTYAKNNMGDTLRLERNYSAGFTATTPITLDLNGFSIERSLTGAVITVRDGGHLTVKDSTATASPVVAEGGTVTYVSGKICNTNSYKTSASAIRVANDGMLTLESGTIVGGVKSEGIFIANSTSKGATNAVVNIKGGLVQNMGEGYGITVYGTGSDKNYQASDPMIHVTGGAIVSQNGVGIIGQGTYNNTKIHIEGGTVYGGQLALYHPQYGELSITGGTLSGQVGVGIKGGNVTIGGTAVIKGTGMEDYSGAAQGSGINLTGDALYIEDNYGRSITVDIKGSTFTSVHAAAVNKRFVPKDAATKATIVIAGGTFSSEPAKEYIRKGLEARLENGVYVVDAVNMNVEFEGASVTLDDKVGVNMGITAPDAKPDDYMLFSLPNGTTQKVFVKDAQKSNEILIFSCNTVAKEMGDTITATFYLDGKPEGTKTYSVKQYAQTVLKQGSTYSKEVKDMVKSMLNYGAAAQKYFNYDADNLVNKDFETAAVTATWNYGDKVLKTEGTIANITSLTAALNLESTVGIKFYLTTTDDISGYTFTYKKGTNPAVTLTPFVEKGKYCVEIPGLYATNFKEDYTLTITAGGNSVVVTYGVYQYGTQAHTQGAPESLQYLMRAMADYCEAGVTYNAANP